MAVANPPPLVPIAGASDREGRSRRNRHLWIGSLAPSRSGHHPHLLVLDHRGAPWLQHRAFSGSLLYGNATRLQADDGSDRGPARGLLRWAKVSEGSGDRRRRASSARGPFPTSFGVLGLTRGHVNRFRPGNKGGWRGGGKSGRGRFCGARLPTPRTSDSSMPSVPPRTTPRLRRSSRLTGKTMVTPKAASPFVEAITDAGIDGLLDALQRPARGHHVSRLAQEARHRGPGGVPAPPARQARLDVLAVARGRPELHRARRQAVEHRPERRRRSGSAP